MSLSIDCPSCGHKLVVTKKQLERTGRCPVCSSLVQLPAPVALGPRLKEPPPVDDSRGKPEARALPSFAIACPACRARMRLLAKYHGTVVRCPDCNEPFTAAEPEPEVDEDSGPRKKS